MQFSKSSLFSCYLQQQYSFYIIFLLVHCTSLHNAIRFVNNSFLVNLENQIYIESKFYSRKIGNESCMAAKLEIFNENILSFFTKFKTVKCKPDTLIY